MTVDEQGEVASADDFDPWGLTLDGRSINNGQDEARWKFTGKERDTETGLDYFGARYYDNRVARWLSVDPLAEKYPSLSPFTYVMNNPIVAIDPDGRLVVKIVGQNTRHERVVAEHYGTTAMGIHMAAEFGAGVFSPNPWAMGVGALSMLIREASDDPSVEPTWGEYGISAAGFGLGLFGNTIKTTHPMIYGATSVHGQGLNNVGLASDIFSISNVELDEQAFLAANRMRVDGSSLTNRDLTQTTTTDKTGNKVVTVSQPQHLQSITLNTGVVKQWGGAKISKGRLEHLLATIKLRIQNGLTLNYTHKFEDKTEIRVGIDE